MESLTKGQLARFFANQVLSERVLDSKRAYLIALEIYDEGINKSLWESWKKYHDNNCMVVLARKSDRSILADHFVEIWQSENLKFFVKNDVLERVARYDFSLVEFLKVEAPISYLSACVAAGKDISNAEAIAFASSADTISSFRYALWCLGMLGKQNALYALIHEAKGIEARLLKEYWEPYWDVDQHEAGSAPIEKANNEGDTS